MKKTFLLIALLWNAAAFGISSQNATMFFGGDVTNGLPSVLEPLHYFDSSDPAVYPSLRISSSTAAAVLSTVGGILQRHILSVEPERLSMDVFEPEYFRTNDFLGCFYDNDDKYALASNRTFRLARISGDYLEYAYKMFKDAVNSVDTWGGWLTTDGDLNEYVYNYRGWGSSVLDAYVMSLNPAAVIEEDDPELLEYNPEFPEWGWRDGSAWQWRSPGQWAYTWPMLCYSASDGVLVTNNTSYRPPDTILDLEYAPVYNPRLDEYYLETNPPVMRAVSIPEMLQDRFPERTPSNYNARVTSKLIDTRRMSHSKAGTIQYAVAMMDRLYGSSHGIRWWKGEEKYMAHAVDNGGSQSLGPREWNFVVTDSIPGAYVGTISITTPLSWGQNQEMWTIENTTNYPYGGQPIMMHEPFYSCSGVHHGYGGILSASAGIVITYDTVKDLVRQIGSPGGYVFSVDQTAPGVARLSWNGFSSSSGAYLDGMIATFSLGGSESTFVVYPGNIVSNADPQVSCGLGIGHGGSDFRGRYLWSLAKADVYAFDRMESYGEYTSAAGLSIDGSPEQSYYGGDYGLSVCSNYLEQTRIRKLGIARNIGAVSNLVLSAADSLKAATRARAAQLVGADIEDPAALLAINSNEINSLRNQIDGAARAFPAVSGMYMSSLSCSCTSMDGPFTITYTMDTSGGDGNTAMTTNTIVLTSGAALTVGSIQGSFVPDVSIEGTTPPASVYGRQYFPTRYRFSFDTITLNAD